MTDLPEGVSLESFNNDPPMLVYGKIGEWWYALHWWRRDWVFVVDPKVEKVLIWPYMPDLKVRVPWDRLAVQWQKFSPLQQGDRPTENTHLVAKTKEIIVACAKEFRESIGPREWSPRWPKEGKVANG